MGGTVQARSAPDQGSVFEVRLPDGSVMPADSMVAQVQPAPPAALPGVPRARAGRLLYIEDNPVNLLIVQEALAQRPDLQLDTACDGLSGVALAQDTRPDLCWSTCSCPTSTATKCCAGCAPRRPRRHSVHLGVGQRHARDIARALRAGFADYWTKPLDLRRFPTSLEAIFGAPPRTMRACTDGVRAHGRRSIGPCCSRQPACRVGCGSALCAPANTARVAGRGSGSRAQAPFAVR